MTNQAWNVMGILNITPDSFFDGGTYGIDLSKTIDRASSMIRDGATILDVGGESTRPGSKAISLDEEQSRVSPVIESLSSRFDITISVDTTKSKVALDALQNGAHWVNDISAGRFDSEMCSVVNESEATIVLMHSRKRPETMQDSPHYTNVTSEVKQELLESVELFTSAGVLKSKIILDPGIGFAKSVSDNITLLQECSQFTNLGFPVLIGTSRKSFIGNILGKEVAHRLAGSLATVGETYRQGASLFRVHDVAETVDFLKMMDSIRGVA